MRHEPKIVLHGATIQAALPKSKRREAGSANGLLLRGVVIAAYDVDARSPHLVSSQTPEPTENQLAVYCDVLLYSSHPSAKRGVLHRVLVSQERGGMHDGSVWRPRAATLNIGGAMTADFINVNPADLDGDHVLVGFMDDDIHNPVILRAIPHPSADAQSTETVAGARLKPTSLDGQNNFQKFRGSYFGLDQHGNFVVDLTRATIGEYGPNGEELPNGLVSDDDSSVEPLHGNVSFILPAWAGLSLTLGDGSTLQIHDRSFLIELQDGKQRLQFYTDGSMEVVNEQASILVHPDGKTVVTTSADIETTAANTKTTAADANFVTQTMKLGDGAVEHLVLGDSWQAAQAQHSAAIVAALTAISAAIASIDPIVGGTLSAALTGPLSTISSALASPSLLSTANVTK